MTGNGVTSPKKCGHGEGPDRRWISSRNFHIHVNQSQSNDHGHLGRDSEEVEDCRQAESHDSHVKTADGEQVKGSRLEKESFVLGFQIAFYPQHHSAEYSNRVRIIFDAASQKMDAPFPETGREDFLQRSFFRRLEESGTPEEQGDILVEKAFFERGRDFIGLEVAQYATGL